MSVHAAERRAEALLPFLVSAFALFMLASLVWGFLNPFFFGSDVRTLKGIDFFSTPKAFRNVLEGRSMYDSWGGPAYGPYSTWYLMHPAFTVFVASFLSIFEPWVSYGLFTLVSSGILALCARILSSLTPDAFEKRLMYVFFFCSFVTFWLLYVGNMHVFPVLGLTLVLAGMYELAYGDGGHDAGSARKRIAAGLLISLFSKPLVLLALPALLVNRATRRVSLRCLGVYVVVSLAFLFTPTLNPESVGFERMMRVALDPEFVRRHLDIYANRFALNEYMKDNAIHWLNLVAQSGASFNHIDIFSLSAFVDSALGTNIPGWLYKAPLFVVLLLSAGLLLVRDERERLRLSTLVVIASTFTFFLSYNTVWEYQYAALFPCVALLFLMARRRQIGGRLAPGILGLCVFYYLPSPYVLVRGGGLGISDINWIRSTKVVPSLICFLWLVSVVVARIRASAPRERPDAVKQPPLPPRILVPELAGRKRGFSLAFFLAAACGFALLFAAYSNIFGNAFHFDDSHVVVNNLYIRNLADTGRFFTDVRTTSALPQNQTYRPIVTLSLAVDYALGHGLSSRVFHLDQLLLFALFGIALFFFYLRVMERASPGPLNRFLALFAATLFCVHTANTETMNLMHARSEILSALGIVGGFLVYLGAPRLRRFQLHLVPMAAGALAKTPAVLLAPLLFVWEFLVPGSEQAAPRSSGTRLKSAMRATAPAFVAGIALFWFIEKRMAPPTLNYGGGDRIAYAQTQLWVWLHYLRLFVLPVGLSADTDLTLIPVWYDTRVIAGACVLAALAWVALRCSRLPRAWPVTFGLAWFAIGLLPTSSVIPLAEPMNEHRVFLPYIGLVLAAVWGARLLLAGRVRHMRAIGAVCVAVLAALALGTHTRNQVWRTEETLWADVTAKSPANGRAWMNYGTALMGRGAYANARECYERAALLTPSYWTLEINQGILEDAVGNAAAAEAHFKRAIVLGPGQPDTHYFFASWLVRAGRGPEARDQLETALRLSPGAASTRGLLMDLLAAIGDSSGAAALAREALAVDPSNARARAYLDGGFPPDFGTDATARRQSGVSLGQKGEYIASALAYRAALLLEPADADSLNNLGWTLGKLGFFAQAVPPLERALAIQPSHTLARNNLAWVKGQIR